MEEQKQLSVRNQKIVNLVEIQINDLKQTLQILGNKSSVNQFKQYTAKLQGIYGQLRIVFDDHNFSEVYDHIKKLLMNYEILFISMLDRIQHFDKKQQDYQKKIQEIESRNLEPSTPSNTCKKQRQPTHTKSGFSRQEINTIQQTIETIKSNKMGGIHLYNQNYMRGVQAQFNRTAKKDQKIMKKQFNDQTNTLLNQMDEAQIQLRLQSDEIDNFLALRRGKQKMFNHVSYSGDLQEIANFFKQTQDDAIDFLNTSKNTTTTTQYTQQFNGLMSDLKAQKEIQSASVMSKINDMVEFIKKKNFEVQSRIQNQYLRLKKLKQEMNKKKVEVAVQTTHNFAEQIKKLETQLTEQQQKYQALVVFKQETHNYQDQYFQALKQVKVKQMQAVRYQIQIRQKRSYIEDLQKKIRIMGGDRNSFSIQKNKGARLSKEQIQKQQSEKSHSNIGKSGYLATESPINKTYKRRKSSQVNFIKQFAQKRESYGVVSETESPSSTVQRKRSGFGKQQKRQSSIMKNIQVNNKRVSNINQTQTIDEEEQFQLYNKPSTRKLIKAKSIKKIMKPSDKSLTSQASSSKKVSTFKTDQQATRLERKQSFINQIQTTQPKFTHRVQQNAVINSNVNTKASINHKRQPSIQNQIIQPKISLYNKVASKTEIKRQTENIQQIVQKQVIQIIETGNKVENKGQQQFKLLLNKPEIKTSEQNQSEISFQEKSKQILSNKYVQNKSQFNDSENSEYNSQEQQEASDQNNGIPSIQKIQNFKDKQQPIIYKKQELQQLQQCEQQQQQGTVFQMRINIIDIDHNKFEQKFQIPQKKKQKRIKKKNCSKQRKQDFYTDFQKQQINIIKQQKMKNSLDNKQKFKIHLQPNQAKTNNQFIKNSPNLKTSGKSLQYNKSNQKIPFSGKQGQITSQISVIVYPFITNSHHLSAHFTKKTQKQFENQFLAILNKLKTSTGDQQFQIQQQQQEKKEVHYVSQHIHKNKYNVMRQKVSPQGSLQATDISKRYKLDKNSQLLLKKKIDKKQLSFSQYSYSVEQNLQFEKLKNTWKKRCFNIQQQKQQIIKTHLESCGSFCIHLQRYLHFFQKISQNDRKTLKIHIQNINKYQGELATDFQRQNNKQIFKMHMTNTNTLGKENKLQLQSTATNYAKKIMRQTVRHYQHKRISKNNNDMSLPHIKK